MFHHDEAPELLGESAEQFLDCENESNWDAEDWAEDCTKALRFQPSSLSLQRDRARVRCCRARDH